MPNYIRARVPGATYFFTVNLLERRKTLLVDHIDILRDAVRATQRRHPFHIDAWVVLPDHMHTVWTLPEGDAAFALRWAAIKRHFSSSLPKTERLSDVRQRRGERGIWQRRFWEHMIRDDSDFQRHIEYCYFNPVKHGHVNRVCDWPYSSFHRDVREMLFPADWAGDCSLGTDTGERR